MDKLPLEIIRDIFLTACHSDKKKDRICIRPNRYTYRTTFSRSTFAALYISHVCRSWRRITLSYGDFWSYMCIGLAHGCSDKTLAVMKEVFDTWLSRSRSSPLSIVLQCYVVGAEEAHSTAEHMIKALIDQQHRWKDMWFHWHLSSAFRDRINLSNMPLLTSLHIASAGSIPRMVIDISRCLRLRSLNVEGADVLTGGTTIETLKEASSFIDPDGYGSPFLAHSCLSFLRAAPNLKHFHVIFDDNMAVTRSTLNDGYSHLSHQVHQLQALKVWRGDAATFVLDSVTLPSLQALSCNTEEDFALFLRFIQRSMPPLTFLEIQCADGPDLLSVLRLMPALADLRLIQGVYTKLFFRELTVFNVSNGDERFMNRAVLCPRLVSFHLSGCYVNENDDSSIRAFIDMMKSRHEILETFKKVELHHYSSKREIDMADIDQEAEFLFSYLDDGKVIIKGDDAPSNPLLDL